MNSPSIPTLSIYLRPGEVYLADKPSVVTTVLGSCISVTMFSNRLKTGAICHALLPEGSPDEAFRYVDGSIYYMLARLTSLGVTRREIEVKMFGGSDLLTSSENMAVKVGGRNIQVAKEVLKAEGLSLAKEDVGGLAGRKILFHTHTGDVWLKRLRRNEILESDLR